MKSITVFVFTVMMFGVAFHLERVDAVCDGLRRLACHIQCTRQLTQCNVHTCECYHYKQKTEFKNLLMMLRVPVTQTEVIEQKTPEAKPQAIEYAENHNDVEMVLLDEV